MLTLTLKGRTVDTFPLVHLIAAGSNLTVKSRHSFDGSALIFSPRSMEYPVPSSALCAVLNETGQWPTLERVIVLDTTRPYTT